MVESMPAPCDDTIAQVLDVANLGFGAGVIVSALFPFAVPLIALTLVAAIPLVVVALAAGLLAAPIILVRRLTR